MRRLAVSIVMAWVGVSTAGWAADFDRLGRPLQRHDQRIAAQRPPHERPVNYQAPSPELVDGVDAGPWNQGGYDHGGPYDHDSPYGHGHMEEHCAACAARAALCDIPPCGLWSRIEYLVWWMRGANTPPLVTSNPDGILPDSTILFGDKRINTEARSGGRFTLGYWFGGCNCLGLEGNVLCVGNANDSFVADSDGSPVLARPFFNVISGLEDANLVATTGIITGNIGVNSSRRTSGVEVNLRKGLFLECDRRLDLLAGYRYFHLAESLEVTTNTVSIDPNNPDIQVGTTFGIFDSFLTRDNFHGAQVGLNSQATFDRWTVDLLGKLAVGSMWQRVAINGSTVVTAPQSTPVTNGGGILALNSNIGDFSRNRFALLPEFAVTLHYCFNPVWSASIGYNLMVVTNVVRPGDQIDRRLDPNQFPPPIASGTFPTFAFHDSDVWLQGINFGLECNF